MKNLKTNNKIIAIKYKNKLIGIVLLMLLHSQNKLSYNTFSEVNNNNNQQLLSAFNGQ